jgi:hypothetical protein
MGLTVITSAAGHHRIARCRDWLKARGPAEEILIIGATPGAANELARSIAQEKRASFGYHRLTLAQLASGPILGAVRHVRDQSPRAAAQPWNNNEHYQREPEPFQG